MRDKFFDINLDISKDVEHVKNFLHTLGYNFVQGNRDMVNIFWRSQRCFLLFLFFLMFYMICLYFKRNRNNGHRKKCKLVEKR